MSYSYSVPANYNPQNYPQQNNPSSSIVALGSVLGGITGCTVGCIKNPCKTDSFAKKVYLKQADEEAKTVFKQRHNVLKQLKNIKTVDKLKELFNKNKEAAQVLENVDLDNVTKDTLKDTVKTIKNKFEADNRLNIQNIKNQIETYLKEGKESIDNDLLKSIKKVKYWEKAKTIGKYTAIGAIITGIAAAIGQTIINSQAQKQINQQNI